MRRFFFGMAMLAVAFAAPGWANADDHQIAQQIAQQLRIEKDQGNLKGFGIDLQVDQGTVWMKGEVSSVEQRTKALEIARRTSGVKQVVNDLVVRSDTTPETGAVPPAAPTAVTAAPSQSIQTPQAAQTTQPAQTTQSAQPAKPAQPVAPAPATAPATPDNQLRKQSDPSDEELAGAVMSQLKMLKDSGRLKGFSLEVKPKNGQVWMIGRVASDEQRQLVLNTTAHVSGVRQVVNAIRVEEAETATAKSRKPETRGAVATKPAAAPQVAAGRKTESTKTETTKNGSNGTQSSSRRGLLSRFWSNENSTNDTTKERAADRQPASAPSIASRPETKSAQVSNTKAVERIVANKPARSTSDQDVLLVNNEQSDGPPTQSATQPVQAASVLQRTPAAIGSGLPPQPVAVASLTGSTVTRAQAPPAMVYQPVPNYAPVAFAASQIGQPAGYGGQPGGAQFMPASQQMGGAGMGGVPVPMHSAGPGYGASPARYDHPNMPGYAWPSYAAYPNYAAVTYPQQYSPTAWPYIGPFYPYPQVPLGWRKVTLEWDDGWWQLDFKSK